MGHGQQKRGKLQNHVFEKIEKKDFDPKTRKLHIISIFMTKSGVILITIITITITIIIIINNKNLYNRKLFYQDFEQVE